MLKTCHCMLACMLTPLDLAFEDTCLGVLKGYKPMKKWIYFLHSTWVEWFAISTDVVRVYYSAFVSDKISLIWARWNIFPSSLQDRMSCQSNFYVVCGNCELAADLLSLLFLSQSVIYISSSKSCSSAFRLNSTRIFFVSLYAQYRFYFNIKHINRGSNDA